MEYGNLRISHGQWPFIVSFPTKKWWFIHSFLYVYQRVALQIYLGMMNYWAGEAGKPIRLDMSAWFDRQFPGCFWWLEHVGTCWNMLELSLKTWFLKVECNKPWRVRIFGRFHFDAIVSTMFFCFWTMFFFNWLLMVFMNLSEVGYQLIKTNEKHIRTPSPSWGFWCLYQTSLERWGYDTYKFLINRDTPDTVTKLDWIPSLRGILINP